MKHLLVISAIAAFVVPLAAQFPKDPLTGISLPGGSTLKTTGPRTGPAPRLPDGTIDLDGVWLGGGPVNDVEEEGGLKKGEVDSLLLPWAKKLMDSRDVTQEPHNRCLPMGIPRVTPFPWRFVQNYTHKKPTHLFQLHEGNIHSFRQIFMDGRKHPAEMDPTWFGYSIGWYEKDTLVIDTRGYNDKAWFDRKGHPRTEQMQTVERWTRQSMALVENKITFNDPGAYSKPFTATFLAALSTPDDLQEYICQENNQYGAESIPGWADKFTKP